MPGSRKSRRTPPPARADVESLVFRWGAQIDPALLDLALTHRSWAHENGGLPTNERLEFLEDSILSIVGCSKFATSPIPTGQSAFELTPKSINSSFVFGEIGRAHV